jgi:hypothetical protein
LWLLFNVFVCTKRIKFKEEEEEEEEEEESYIRERQT